ncbi:MAG TPA: hypothetical protein VMS65_07160, partial [Polyangiaceae bacterium]|nr:hypothetical protein [Polyangiaceae bacterium]
MNDTGAPPARDAEAPLAPTMDAGPVVPPSADAPPAELPPSAPPRTSSPPSVRDVFARLGFGGRPAPMTTSEGVLIE